MKQIAIAVPCFNEEAVIRESCNQLSRVVNELVESGLISADSGVYFIDDGSRDRTWAIIEELASKSDLVHGIKLSKNRGHQYALLAGLLNLPGDAVISLDADLQDDPNIIEKMVRLFSEGIDIVFAVRSAREYDTFFKRTSAQTFYGLMRMLGVDTIADHADYRLMSRRALDALSLYSEFNIFLRGIVPQLGFSTAIVKYERNPRAAGETKYSLRKMISFAVNGITSFSIAPLRMISLLGIIVSMISFSVGVWAILTRLFTETAAPGWASTVVPLSFLGGIQLLSLGIVGEYIGKTYIETTRRPRYIIEKTL
jgi:glycosyltransferase involved in cell wall biosynthesis